MGWGCHLYFVNEILKQNFLDWLDSFGLCHINLRGLFNAKVILLEEQWGYYWTHSWRGKGGRAFLLWLSPKVNVVAWLEFELTYFVTAVEHVSHYSHSLCWFFNFKYFIDLSATGRAYLAFDLGGVLKVVRLFPGDSSHQGNTCFVGIILLMNALGALKRKCREDQAILWLLRVRAYHSIKITLCQL